MMSLFYFEGFTYNISEKELWEVFQKWERFGGFSSVKGKTMEAISLDLCSF